MTIYNFISSLVYINSNFDFEENEQVIFVLFHFNYELSTEQLEKAKNALYDAIEVTIKRERKDIPYSFINNTLCFTVSKEYFEK